MVQLDEEDQRLLSAADAAVRENQQRLQSLAGEARLQYQRRVAEWEQCRDALDRLSALLKPQSAGNAPGDQAGEFDSARAALFPEEALLRDRQSGLAERVYRLQRTSRLLGTSIRHLERESIRPLQVGDDFLKLREEEELQAENQDRVLRSYEQERLRLAREIHDGPAQILANAIFELEYFERLLDRDPASVASHLAQLKSDIREGLTEVRRFIFDLRPPALAEMGLFVALRRYLDDFERRFGVAVQSELPEMKARLAPSKEMALFRIAQEALRNIQKHAHASKVVVTGAVEDTCVRLTVEDDGRGFDLGEVASRHSRRYGLISMRERAGLIQAQLHITSTPGGGTRVSVVVPLDRSAG